MARIWRAILPRPATWRLAAKPRTAHEQACYPTSKMGREASKRGTVATPPRPPDR
eukprot:CAMPEP_0175778260 /NCGR_PEP_ID=MMETSP0097-20121207/75603_1 /TAXON_ID=311494 /ORGANISM="Alexandrium monilatum, Strain CCMP3105" /LENGTH=54 /DNA_ID=CAMNT_0017088899 /DNA_START=59 /DNA_END=220 /DNA_ORIENTATION=+